MRVFLIILCLLTCHLAYTQPKKSGVAGKITNEDGIAIAGAYINVLGKTTGTISSDSGTFFIPVRPYRFFGLVFSHIAFEQQQQNYFVKPGDTLFVEIILGQKKDMLEDVVVTDQRPAHESGLIIFNPKNATILPSTTGGVEALIKTLVGSNNELTSQYNVRGGNFDENLVYINDIEIFRPYLVSSGQQEGLSIINPEMASNVLFYTGGFQAKYGDKLSSVLDIRYRKPTKFGGSVYMGLMEQGLQLEGITKNKKFTYQIGARNKSNQNLLKSQPTKGVYIPASSDIQTYLSYQLHPKWQWDFLGIYSNTRFDFYPEMVKKTASVFSPFFTANLGLDVYFEGSEKDRYSTLLTATSFQYKPHDQLQLKWQVSRFVNEETEAFDIGGAYLFGDRNFDRSSSSFGLIANPLGSGYYQDYARNKLKITSWQFSHRGQWEKDIHVLQWGLNVDVTSIDDHLKQWQYQDSAGYNIPYQPGNIDFLYAVDSKADLKVNKYAGFFQDNMKFHSTAMDMILQAGLRFNYNDLNNEFLFSPRAQITFLPYWKQNITFKAATGFYHQPSFYRELRDKNGNINKDIKAQKSWHLIAGMDYQFKGLQNRNLRLSVEAYYKKLWDVVPYDVDNVKIRYHGDNNATAYATGIEFRLFGELVEGAESWISLGLMRTKEDLFADYYMRYYNAAGELITGETNDRVPKDSSRNYIGHVRRPSDRLITLGMFLQDYLTTNKNFKVHLNLLYGSNMPFNIPDNPRFRNGLTIEPYIRADLGLSATLLKEKKQRRSFHPLRNVENIWVSLEVLNIIDRANTISYQLIKDFSNTTFAIPNRLTPRMFNIKVLTRF